MDLMRFFGPVAVIVSLGTFVVGGGMVAVGVGGDDDGDAATTARGSGEYWAGTDGETMFSAFGSIPCPESDPIADNMPPLIPGLGAFVREVDGGLEVLATSTGSGAEAAGLERGDIITSIDFGPVGAVGEVWVYEYEEGEEVVVAILRDGEPIELTVTFGPAFRDIVMTPVCMAMLGCGNGPCQYWDFLPDSGLPEIEEFIAGEFKYLDAEGQEHTLSFSVGVVERISESEVAVIMADGTEQHIAVYGDDLAFYGVGLEVAVVRLDSAVIGVFPVGLFGGEGDWSSYPLGPLDPCYADYQLCDSTGSNSITQVCEDTGDGIVCTDCVAPDDALPPSDGGWFGYAPCSPSPSD